MNLRQTAELAALAAIKAADVIRRPEPVSTQSLHAYWKASRVRLRCWFAVLRTWPVRGNEREFPSPLLLGEYVRVSRAILVAELLARVWATVLTARDVTHKEDAARAVVRNVFNGQLEARREVLQLLCDERRVPAAAAAALDRLRHRVERWTDVLVGPLVHEYDVCEFAFDAERARGSIRSSSPLMRGDVSEAVNHLTLLGLSHAFPGSRCKVDDLTAATLDRAVARAVLSAINTSTAPSKARDPSLPISSQSCLAVDSTGTPTTTASSVQGLRFAQLRRRIREH